MSATFNWAYKPGSVIPYVNFTIPTTADNVKPTNVVYVALFGNDTTGNGSRQYPYRTIQKGYTAGGGGYIIVGSGVYREVITFVSGTVNIVGDGDVILDATTLGTYLVNNTSAILINVQVKGAQATSRNTDNNSSVTHYKH